MKSKWGSTRLALKSLNQTSAFDRGGGGGGGGGGRVKEMKLGLTRLALESWKSIGDQNVCSKQVF